MNTIVGIECTCSGFYKSLTSYCDQDMNWWNKPQLYPRKVQRFFYLTTIPGYDLHLTSNKYIQG